MKKVLILDDNPLNNKKYIAAVEKNYLVDKVLKPVSAERLIQDNNYDFIVIDVMMPMGNINAEDETTTGFVFYRDKLMEMGLSAPIIFWTRLEEDAYTSFWNNNIPPNTYFLHKSQEDDHLRLFINSIDNQKR